MPITEISSKSPSAKVVRDRGVTTPQPGGSDDPLDVIVPAKNAQEAGVEEHWVEIQPENAADVVISLALKIKRTHGGDATATASGSLAAQSPTQRYQGRIMSTAEGIVSYGGYKQQLIERFLADVDLFVDRNRKAGWGEIALLKAADKDHRLLVRVREGENFRIDTIEEIAATMTKVEQGEISPDDFRNTTANRVSRKGRKASSPEGTPDASRKPRRNIDLSE